MEYIVLDTETGGLQSKVHSMLSFAMIRCTPFFQPVDEPLHLHCWHDNFVVSSEAMKVNKIDLRESGAWPKRPEVLKAVFAYLQLPEDFDDNERYANERPAFKLCGSNIAYDIGFMREYLGDALYSRIFHYRSEEVTSVFRHLQHAGVIPPNDGMKLFQMATALGIDFEDSKLHGALYDAEVTRQIARELHKRSEVLKYAFEALCKSHKTSNPQKIIDCFAKPGCQKRLDRLLLTGSADDEATDKKKPKKSKDKKSKKPSK
jgi:DNA polymerase III epsilon subunit-like protein